MPAWYVTLLEIALTPSRLASLTSTSASPRNIALSTRFDVFVPNTPPPLEDTEGMLVSVGEIQELVRKEVEEEGIEEGQVLLGGFSQGASP